jgi:chaperonin cofactor prefoldin
MAPNLVSVRQAPLAPVLGGEGLGVRGFSHGKSRPLTPNPSPRSTEARGFPNRLLPSRLGLAAALLLLLAPHGRADDWKYDVVVLKPGALPEGPRILKGLFIGFREDAGEVEIRVIHREEGEPTRLEPSTFKCKRTDYESIEPLDPADRAILEERIKALTRTPQELNKRFEKLKPEAIQIEFGKAGKKKGFRYKDDGEHFVLESNVNEDLFVRSAKRLALLYNAFSHTLPARHPSGKPTTILLAGTQADYQALLRERGLNIFNPAFYDPARNQVVCGTDLERLGAQLEQARKDNEKVAEELKKRMSELQTLYKGKVPPEVLRPLVDSEKQLVAARAANDKFFDEATRVLFGRLSHESFHAYLAAFVYTGERAEMPRWLNEGLAQLYETALIEGDEVRIARPNPERLKRARAANELVPLKDLLRSGPKQFVVAHASDKELSDRYYLTSWALALYLASEGRILGTKKLDDYCRATHAKEDPLETFAALVGKKGDDLTEFEEKFREFVQKRPVRPK